MKTILEEAMATYVNELNKIGNMMNAALEKANKAAFRGDAVNYKKNADQAVTYGNRINELMIELHQIEAAYAAI